MTDLVITSFGDAWVNDLKPDVNYGSTSLIRVKSGEHRGFLLPALPNIAGRTVTSAILIGHAQAALAAQTLTIWPVTERWTPGKVTSAKSPAVDTGEAIAVAIGATPIYGAVQWTVTDHIQAVADGLPWFGWRISTGSTAAGQSLLATDSGLPAWELHITLSDTPDQPTDLRPEGGAVGSTTPTLSWSFSDAGLGGSGQAQSRVQVDTPTGGADPDEVAPDYDSGWEANIEPEWSLAGEHTLSGAGPHYWRVMVETDDGDESVWSDWAEFTRVAKPTLVVDSPTGPFGDPTPVVAAHLSSGTISQWQAKITGADRSDVRYSTGTQTGAVSFTVPLKAKDGRRVLIDDVTGWLNIRIYPEGDWVTAVGETTYLETWVEIEWDDDLGVEAPTDLNVTQTAPGDPRHTWTWDRSEAADAYLAQVAGRTIARIEAEDVTVDAGTYTWDDNGQIPPLRTHTLAIRAIEGDERSTQATQAAYSYAVSGVWLLPEADIEPVQLAGVGVSSFARTDYRAPYTTNTGDQIDILYGTPGRSGDFEGSVDSRDGATVVWAAIDSVDALRASKDRMAQVVWGSQSVTARIRDVDATSADDILPNNLQHVIRFGFVEVLG